MGPWLHRQPDLARRRTVEETRGRPLDPRERQRATSVALHLTLTRERLGHG